MHSTLVQLMWKDGEGFLSVKKTTIKTIQCSWCITEGNFHRGLTVAEHDHHIFQIVGSIKICYVQFSSSNLNTLKTWAPGMHLIIHDTTLSWNLISKSLMDYPKKRQCTHTLLNRYAFPLRQWKAWKKGNRRLIWEVI